MEDIKIQMSALLDQAFALGVASVVSVDVQAAVASAVAAEKARILAGLDEALNAEKAAVIALVG